MALTDDQCWIIWAILYPEPEKLISRAAAISRIRGYINRADTQGLEDLIGCASLHGYPEIDLFLRLIALRRIQLN